MAVWTKLAGRAAVIAELIQQQEVLREQVSDLKGVIATVDLAVHDTVTERLRKIQPPHQTQSGGGVTGRATGRGFPSFPSPLNLSCRCRCAVAPHISHLNLWMCLVEWGGHDKVRYGIDP